MTAVQPFTIHVPDEVLADLRERLARTRWPGEIRVRRGTMARIWPISRIWSTTGGRSLTGAPGGGAEPLRALSHYPGWHGYSLHPRARQGAQPAAPHHHPRLAQHRL